MADAASVKKLFDEAIAADPCIILIDRVENCADLIGSFMEGLECRVLVIGMTTQLDLLNPSLLGTIRFAHDISLSPPGYAIRSQIWHKICNDLNLSGNIDTRVKNIARNTAGLVAIDFAHAARAAAKIAYSREQQQQLSVVSTSTLGASTSNNSSEHSQPFRSDVIAATVTFEDLEAAIYRARWPLYSSIPILNLPSPLPSASSKARFLRWLESHGSSITMQVCIRFMLILHT